jgi:hypothetical protein
MRTTISMLALTLLITATIQARADMGRPIPSPARSSEVRLAINTGMEIVPDAKAYGARLQISQATLNELREATNAGTTSQSFTGRFAGSMNTIIAGLFLFMSISFTGVWLARSAGKRALSQKALAAVLISFAMLGAAAIITQANIGPPPASLWRNLPKNLTAGKSTSGGVEIEIVPEGDGVKLIVPMKNSNRTTDD